MEQAINHNYDRMQKVKLIKIEEIKVYPDQMTIEIAPPKLLIHDVPIPGMGPSLADEEIYEVREQVPINEFRSVDRIPVSERELTGKSIEQLLAEGYHISQEDNTFEKVQIFKTAMTVEARHFLEMEKESIRDLLSHIDGLRLEVSKKDHMLKRNESRVKQLEEEKDNRWIEKIKRFFLLRNRS
ncbi:MAG: hypothetical protein GY797_01535 [Deltaproteobacteria bacterium]|nr:hypothetical protein [Deltaproteobacteria bacterium]